jgi:superfamily I DNA/RNA helicase/RecB family exonuclease
VNPSAPREELVLDRTVPHHVVPLLDPAQAQVCAHSGGPLLVLGGPGSGKTTALVAAAATQVVNGADPVRILLLTLGRSSVAALRVGLAARLPDSTIPDVRTWHGFAYSVVDADRLQRAASSESGEQAAVVGPLQLLTGAEYESRVRELILGSIEDGKAAWPKSLQPALTTRGFARDLRALLVQLRTLGLEPGDLARLAHAEADEGLRDTLLAAADFAADAFNVFDFEGVTDHADVLHRAALVLADATSSSVLAPPYDAVFVDQAQDLDPAMARVLAALARGGTTVVLAADPDQSVEAFRGADPRLLAELDKRVFRREVPTLVLPTDHAHAGELRTVLERVSSRIAAPALEAALVRDLRSASPSAGIASVPVSVQLKTFDSASAEASHISDLLLRRHSDTDANVPWSDMAVVVHGPAAFAAFARAFSATGIPFEIPRDEVPLRDDPAVRVFLTVLDLASQQAAGRAATPELVRDYVLGPLVQVDSAALRRLSRALRDAAREAGEASATAKQALVEAVLDPRLLLDVPTDDAVDALMAGAALLSAAVQAVQGRRTISEVLWTIWTKAAHYGDRLSSAALRGGADGRRADRDLDAIMGLFDAAERADARYQGRRGVANFLDEMRSLDFAAESLAERGAPAPAVMVLTARRARGQFWPLVVVAGVNEGAWPLVNASHNIVGADRLTADGISAPATRSARLTDERRVFHVAVSRATRELVVTAVASADDNGAQPSRFFNEVAVALGRDLNTVHLRGYPQRSLNVAGLVSSMRRAGVDESADDASVAAAALRLARLAAAADKSGRRLAPNASPARWWGIRAATENPRPLLGADEPVRLSATGLDALETCGLRRFFEREAGAEQGGAPQASMGRVIHAIAEALANRTLPPEPEAIESLIDDVWPQLAPDAAWASEQERRTASELAARLLRWHLADRGRVSVAGEQKFRVTLTVPVPDGTTDVVQLSGAIDRVEVDQADPTGVHIVDFKTTKSPPTKSRLEEHPQLGVYRLIVENGAVDAIVPGAHVSGAELVSLRHVEAKSGEVKVYAVSGPTDDTWPVRLGSAAATVRNEWLIATPSYDGCQYCSLERLCPVKAAGQQVVP